MKYLITLLLTSFSLFYFKTDSCAQKFDTSVVILNAKMRLFLSTNTSYNESHILTFMKKNVKYNFINSKGFENIIFFKLIMNLDTATILVTQNDSQISESIIEPYNHTFIFGYNTINRDIYCMNGLKYNDFDNLFTILKFFKSDEISEGVLKKRSKFEKAFWIEGLDLGCMYDEYHKNSRKKKKICNNLAIKYT